MSEQVTVQVNAIGNFSNLTGEMNKFKSQLQGLKLPKNIMSGIEKAMDNVSEKANKFQSLLAKGINSKGDYSRLVSSAKEYETAISQLDRAMDRVGNKEIKAAVFNSSEIKNAEAQLEKLYKQQKEIANFGSSKGADIINKDSVAEIQKLIGSTAGLKKKFTAVSDAFKTGNIDQANTAVTALIKHVEQYQSKLNTAKNPERGNNILAWAKQVQQYLDTASADVNKFQASLNQLRADKFKQIESNVSGISAKLKAATSDGKQFVNTQLQMAQSTTQMNEQVGHLRTQANYFFGLQNMGRLVARGIREAAESVRDLDKAMTETAVVTDFSVGDMWNMLPEYTKLANKLGATTQGAYETMTLYFQQGLDKKATFEIGEETMKMARIAGLDYADTTNMMTAALRGFNMELNQTSAKRVNDVYSELAAITASDTRELGLAMERTASIAHSAGMDFGNTTAFLAQMIETTREAPENLGTAMKTIIARFQELKENPYDISEVEGEEVDFNRVDKALKSIGVDLMDNRDKFRDLDDVFMDISSKWDGLSQTQQRYVATIAAGARQQSRFLAMVQNYDRLKQLTDAAANSEGASTVQFNKTLESYEAKVNKLSNAWQEFTMHLANNKAIKGGVDILKHIIEYANKIVQAFGKVGGAFGEMFASFGLGAIGFKALKGGANLGLGALARITKSSKGDQMFGSGGRDYGFANRITQPIVNAINAAAARITGTEQKFGTAFNNNRVHFGNFREAQQGLRFTRYDSPNLNDTKITKLKARPVEFNNKDVISKISGYSEEQQKVLLKQVPGTMSALERSYAKATKKLNLSESATNAVTNLRATISKEMLRPGSGISPEAGMNILGNPRELAKYIEDDAIKQEVLRGLNKNRREILLEQAKQAGVGKDKKGYERINALKQYTRQKEPEFYNTNTKLEKGEIWANRFAGITSGATAAGQAVMSLGIALDSMGLHGAGGALTMVGSALTNIGMAASGTVTAVTSLNTALKGIGLSLGPIGIAIGAFTALGVALGVASAKYKKHIQNIQKDSVKVMKDFDKEMTESTSNINKLLDSRDDYFRLSQGVDRNNNNISLGTEEYADYLQIVNDIAKIQPELVKGYNAHGQAILKNNNAVNEAIQAEKDRQHAAEEAFTSTDSLDKLIAGRNSTKRWQVQYDPNAAYTATSKALTKGVGGSLTTSTSSVSKLKQDAQSVVESIQKLKGGDDLLKSMAEQFNIDVTDFTNLTDAGVKAISDHGANMLDQVNSQLSDASDEANQKLIKSVQDGIAQVGKDTQGIEEVTEPIYKSLSTFASKNHLFDNIPDELKDAAELGLKEISKMSVDPATGGKITGAAMQQQVMAQARQLENLNGHKDAYKQILEDVEKAQDNFSKNLSEEDYTAATEDAINKLTVWANQARQSGDAMQIAMAESFEGQIDSIRNFVSEGAALLEDGFNTFADQIEGANSAFEAFQKQIEGGDFYTGAENMKKIFDEIQDGVDNVGKGSQTFWKGAKELLGEQNKSINAGDFKATEKQIKALEPLFQEGQAGADAFFDHVAKKQGEVLDTTGEKVSTLFKVADGDVDLNLDNLSADQFTDLANKLGMSDQMLASMLNKAKQFYDIDFSNVDVLRNALYSAESSIKGTETTGGQTNLYTRQSTFEAEAEAQGYTPTDIQDLVKKVDKEGIKLIPDANTLTSMKPDKFASTMGGYIADMGIKSTQGFVDTFSQLGFSKEELNTLYDKGVEQGLLSESKYDNFDDYYNDTLEKQQENIANTAEEQTADNTAKTAATADAILGALGVTTGGGEAAKDEIFGGKGDDTAAQYFQYGRDKNNQQFKTREDYEKGRQEIQAQVDKWKLIKAGLEASINETSGQQKKKIQAEIDGYDTAIKGAENYLKKGDEVWKSKEQQLKKEEELSKKRKDKETTDNQDNLDAKSQELSNFQKVAEQLKVNPVNLGKIFGLEGDDSLNASALKFSSIINDLDLGNKQIKNLGTALSELKPGQLENLSNADLSNIINQLDLTDGQIEKLKQEHPEIKFDANTEDLNKVDEEADKPTKKERKIKYTAEQIVTQTGNIVGALGDAFSTTPESSSQTQTQTVNITYVPGTINKDAINNVLNTTIPPQLPAKATTQPVTIKINPTIENRLIVNTVVAGAVPNTLNIKTTTQPVTIKINPTIEDRSVVNTVIAGAVPNTLPKKTITQPISIKLDPSVSNPNATNNAINNSKPTETQKTTQNNSITLNSTIANPNEPKEKIKAAIPTSYSATVKASIKMSASVSTKGLRGQMQSAASSASKGLKVSTGVNAKVGAKASGQGEVQALNTAIKSIKGKSVSIKANVSGTSQVNSLKSAISGLHDKTVTVRYKQVGKPGGGGAKGVNNYISHQAPLPHVGSLAKGTQYGRLGPNGRGGLTLTGEKGFEIAWLPSESRSMILGVNGPQMVDLPRDAVVWTNEQSKKIMKGQAIPAGSHAGYSAKGKFSYGNSQSGSSNSKAASNNNKAAAKNHKATAANNKAAAKNNKAAAKVIQKGGKVSVWWENQNRKVDATQRQVDKLLKQFESRIKNFGSTSKTIDSTVKAYRKYLNQSITLNQQSLNQANKELSNLNTKKSGYSISYSVKTSKKKTKTKKEKVNLAGYIQYDQNTGAYVIDQKAISKAAKKNKSRAKAIKEAAEKEINERVSKRNTAEDNIAKAREALEKLNNDIYETFYRWEKSITSVYVLSQKLETISKKLSIAGSRSDLEFAKLEAGIGDTIVSLPKILDALEFEKTNLLEQVKGRKAAAEAARGEFEESLNFASYLDKYLKNSGATNAYGDYTAAQKAFDFLNKIQMDGDNFNYTAAVDSLNNQGYAKEDYEAIKTVLDKIFEKQGNYLDAINEAYTSQKEIYEKIEEMQSFIAEFETSLLSGLEEQAEEEIKQLEDLNSALSKAYKDLIDEVKKKLDERRRREDNAKTESDLAQKRQRLALLQADTSGGNAKEIAQLQKEIADSQQSYQRSLEDQLIQKLQDQGDEAEKQRERQINILEAQKDIAKATDTNLEQVKEWLQNPEANKEQIRGAWRTNKNYDEVTASEQIQIDQEFEQAWAKYLSYSASLPVYQSMVADSVSSIEQDVNTIANNLIKPGSTTTVESLRKLNYSAAQLKSANYSAKQLREGGYNINQIGNAGYNKAQLSEAGISLKDLKANNVSLATARKAGYSIQDARGANYTDRQIHDAGYGIKAFKQATPGKIGAQAAVAAGYKKSEVAKQYGNKIAMTTLNMSGKATQAATGAKLSTLQGVVNANKKDNATQQDLAGVKANIDINGKKKKGGSTSGTVNASGKTVTANKGSTLYSQKINTKTGKTTGKVSKTTIDKLSTKNFQYNKKEATDALVAAIRGQKVGSKINKNMSSLVKAAGIVGKQYKLKNGVYGSINSDGKIYYNTKQNVRIWNAASGKISDVKYSKSDYYKKAGNKNVGREFGQVLVAKKAYTKKQLKNANKQYKTGGLADYTGPAWLDGTPSKPELVLNAQDTKNFLALKDVLSHAIDTTNNTQTYGDVNYKIDINVDRISSDYDVDKIADRIKKKIVNEAGYRTVTQVRKFK